MRRFGLVVAILAGTTACKPSKELVVLHAASLRRVLAEAAAEYEKANPKVHVRLEPSGSQVAIRKVTELNLRADVIAVADAELIDRMMIPRHAQWNLEFATNELVLAHLQHSRFTDEVNAQNWPEILLRPGVRLGRVDPDTAPLGYHTLFAWQLADRSGLYGASGEGLASKLVAAVPKPELAADESELLSRLEARAIDYAFLYRSTAEDHRLKSVVLPAEVNLGSRALDAQYRAAELEVRTKAGAKQRLQAHPITYGLTIPLDAPNRAEAERFVAFLLGSRGQALELAAGFRPIVPAVGRPADALPVALQVLARPASP